MTWTTRAARRLLPWLLSTFALAACSAGVTPAAGPPAAPAAAPAPPVAAPAPPAGPRPVALTILHTNDHHGHAWRWRYHGSPVGGLAARAALVARIRGEVERQGGHVLLLDAGDLNTGSYCSDELHAEPDLAVYRRMGYQALALGNHEFDLTYEALQRQVQAAGFPFLGANVVLRATGRPAFGDVVEWHPGGVAVAALGLTPADTPALSTRGKDPRLAFLDPTTVAAARVPALRARDRVVIGLFHLPLTEIQRLVATVPGIDVVVSGHDHRPLERPVRVGSTIIVQAGADGRFLGRVDLEVPPRGPVVVRRTRLYPIGGDVPEDPGVAASLAAYRRRCSGDVPVGRLLARARRDDLVAGPGTPSPLHNLVADAMRAAARADVAFVNRGGVRADLPAGTVTRQQVHDVLPFTDSLTVFSISGAELLRLVQELSRRVPGGAGALYPSGVTIAVDGPGEVTVRRRGRVVRPRDRLTLAVSTFIAGGGDHYRSFSTFSQGRVLPVSPEAALVAYLRAHDPTAPPCEARVIWGRPPGYRTASPCRLTGELPPGRRPGGATSAPAGWRPAPAHP